MCLAHLTRLGMFAAALSACTGEHFASYRRLDGGDQDGGALDGPSGEVAARKLSFIAARSYPATGTASPASFVVGDFNADGLADLAVVYSTPAVTVLLGTGGGEFAAPRNVDLGGTSNLLAIAAADLNGDGRTDLVTAASDGTITVLTGRGDATFVTAPCCNVGGAAEELALADLNGDRILDLVAPIYDAGTVAVAHGLGDGTFAAPVLTPVDPHPYAVAVGDLNADGKPDVVVVGLQVRSVLWNSGDDLVPMQLPGSHTGTAVAIGDADGDGYQDVLVGDWRQGLYVFYGRSDGTFDAPVNYDVGLNVAGLALANLDGDAYADLIVVNQWDPSISILWGWEAEPSPRVRPTRWAPFPPAWRWPIWMVMACSTSSSARGAGLASRSAAARERSAAVLAPGPATTTKDCW